MSEDGTGSEWPHLAVYQALALVGGGSYVGEGKRLLLLYLDQALGLGGSAPAGGGLGAGVAASSGSGSPGPLDPVAFLAISRLARAELAAAAGRGGPPPPRRALEALCLPALAAFEAARGPAAARLLLSRGELADLHPAEFGGGGGGGGGGRGPVPAARSIEGRWLALRKKWGRESPAFEAMLKLEGECGCGCPLQHRSFFFNIKVFFFFFFFFLFFFFYFIFLLFLLLSIHHILFLF